MNKYGFCFSAIVGLLICCCVMTSKAQLIDTIGSMGIGGQMMNQGVKSTSQGINALKQTQFIQNLNWLFMDIKMNHIGGYTGLNRNSVKGKNPFPETEWTVGSDGGQTFYIEFNNINISLCQKIISSDVGAQKILINGVEQKTSNCSNTSKIKLIYE